MLLYRHSSYKHVLSFWTGQRLMRQEMARAMQERRCAITSEKPFRRITSQCPYMKEPASLRVVGACGLLLEQLVDWARLSTMQASPGGPQASVGHAHQTGASTATQAFVMNDRAEQRFRQLEIKVWEYTPD